MYQTYVMLMLMMPCSSFSYSNTRGVTADLAEGGDEAEGVAPSPGDA